MTRYEMHFLMASGKPRASHWPVIRGIWLKDHPCCAACGGTQDLEVHHKKPFHLHPELELDLNNLITLCEHPGRDCHYRDGHGYNWSFANPNVEEDAASSLAKLASIRTANQSAA